MSFTTFIYVNNSFRAGEEGCIILIKKLGFAFGFDILALDPECLCIFIFVQNIKRSISWYTDGYKSFTFKSVKIKKSTVTAVLLYGIQRSFLPI